MEIVNTIESKIHAWAYSRGGFMGFIPPHPPLTVFFSQPNRIILIWDGVAGIFMEVPYHLYILLLHI